MDSLFVTVLKNILWVLYHYTNHNYKAWQNYINTIFLSLTTTKYFRPQTMQSDISVSHAALKFFSGTLMILTWKRTSWYSQHVLEAEWNSFPKKNRSLSCNFITSLSSSRVWFIVNAWVYWLTAGGNLNVGLSNKSKCNDFKKQKYGGPIRVHDMMFMCLSYSFIQKLNQIQYWKRKWLLWWAWFYFLN